MKLQFESQQDYQIAAMQAVIDVFEGQPLQSSDLEVRFSDNDTGGIAFMAQGIANRLLLQHQQILENIRAVQLRNGLSVSESLVATQSDDKNTTYTALNLTVEMETGTGKTYTFLRTVYELNRTYGFKKFVIVVPSVAIREGTLKNLQITHDHFQELYDKPPIQFSLYDSGKLSVLRNFATSNAVQILVINIDSFAKDENVINTKQERGFKPIEFVQVTRPIVLIDEPQNVETDIRKAAIHNLNPLCTLRYSATHRNLYNLVYSLNPVQAYDLGLVKQIEVSSITSDPDPNQPFVELLDIQKGKRVIKARVAIFGENKSVKGGVSKKEILMELGDNLYWLSGNRSVYDDGFILTSIRPISNEIEFSNGLIIKLKTSANSTSDEVIKLMIKKTIETHFKKEERYLKLSGRYNPVKVLTLFFIDKVANYRQYDAATGEVTAGKFAQWFEEIFDKLAPAHRNNMADLFAQMPRDAFFESKFVHDTDIPQLRPDYWEKRQVHNGYFSQDKGKIKDTNGNTKADNDTYSLIMRDKERLLSVDEPLRFIFSHSALREGWDNPNVFQICTLNESRSEFRKRQEIGRGLRLCVDSTGQRIFDKQINILTVIANESYQDFCAALQNEIQEETSVEFTGRIKNARDKAKIELNKQLTPENCPLFFDIWERIKQKTRYVVEYSTAELIQKAAEALNDASRFPRAKRPKLEASLVKVKMSNRGITSELKETSFAKAEEVQYEIPDVYAYIQSKIDVTRSTICDILIKSERYEELSINPQMFLDNAISAIRQTLNKLLAEKVDYKPITGTYYGLSIFEDEQIETYLSGLFPVSIEHTDKTLYNFIPIDSAVEEVFARECEANTQVRFYMKLPKGFKIPTPLGFYNPDWAVIFENDARIYFVVETKSTFDYQSLREVERLKIECGKKHFAVLKSNGVEYKLATELRDIITV